MTQQIGERGFIARLCAKEGIAVLQTPRLVSARP
jgi:hypothetical protein